MWRGWEGCGEDAVRECVSGVTYGVAMMGVCVCVLGVTFGVAVAGRRSITGRGGVPEIM